ncbi:MAG: TorF family putative porin [Immundisolibacteraceae bacterium]|nr:TorF family putative porin [Immundisolibacteraceae bacterium]
MKKVSISSLIAAGLLATTAQAEITANVALSTDYMYRGISQTDSTPALSGGFDYSHESGFYAGLWASNVDSAFYSGANIEIDTYFGYGGGNENWAYDVGFLRYFYPGSNFSDNNFNEVYGSLSRDFGVASVTAGLALSDDFYGVGNSEYYTLGVDIPVGDYSVAVGYGAQDMDKAQNYDHYTLGISGEIESAALGWDLTWYGSDSDAETFATDNLTDGRVVFTLSKSL